MTVLINDASGISRSRAWDIGTGVAGYAWDACDPNGVVLLQHGYAEYAQRYVHEHAAIVLKLLEAGFSVRAFDFRGHGHSPGPKGIMDVGVAVQDHLRAREMVKSEGLPVYLFGHSLGGLVTVGSVCHDQRDVHGVVLSSPALDVPDSAFTRHLTKVLAIFAPGMGVGETGNPEALSRLPMRVEAVRGDPLYYRGRVTMLVAATALELAHRNQARYPQWKVPTLVVHGTDDAAVDAAGSRKLIADIASSDKALHIEQDGRHELLNDLCAQNILDKIITWMTARLP